MQENIDISWALVFPIALALIYGSTSLRAISALGYVQKPALTQQLKNTLPVLALFLLWCMVPIPPILFYVLLFVSRMAGRVKRKRAVCGNCF